MFLAQRTALVTGGARGIGRAVALALAREGAGVVVNYSSSEEAASEVVRAIRAEGGRAVSLQADVADPAQVARLVQGAEEAFGPVDILVNNAGITRDSLLIRMKDEDWQRVLDVDLTGAYNCTRAVLRQMMRRRWGRIVNISSVVGLVGNAGQANYSAAKAGLIGFTRAVAREVASRGITANAIAPGYIETDMTQGLPESVKEQLLGTIPMGYLGQVEDVAGLVVFLVSDSARYITGQVIAVDGGMTMQ